MVEAIKREWDIGLGTLPAIDFSHLFKIPLLMLLEKSTNSLIDWFSVIRTGRILHEDPQLPKDIFYSDSALCRWVGIVNMDKLHKKQKKRKQNRLEKDVSEEDTDSSASTSGSSESSGSSVSSDEGVT